MPRLFLAFLVTAFASLVFTPITCAQGWRWRRPKASDLEEVFRPVVAEARASTVEVLAAGEKIALGTIVRSDGWIFTKASELEEELRVLLPDGTVVEAEIVASDPDTDLALLRVDRKGLDAVEWRSDAARVGHWVATASRDEDPASVGVVSVAARRISSGRMRSNAFLGISWRRGSQPVVGEVTEGQAAQRAGLRAGDRVLTVNGTAIETQSDFRDQFLRFEPGDAVDLGLERAGENVEVEAILGSWPRYLRPRSEQLAGSLSARRGGFSMALQHDSILAPDDCGGPLVDSQGRAVGINIARAGRVSSYAIPASTVRATLAQLLEAQRVSTLESGRPEAREEIAAPTRPAAEATPTARESVATEPRGSAAERPDLDQVQAELDAMKRELALLTRLLELDRQIAALEEQRRSAIERGDGPARQRIDRALERARSLRRAAGR